MYWNCYYIIVIGSTAMLLALIGYFVKIFKEGKRHDSVRDDYNAHCPLTPEESRELANSNNIG